MSKEEADVSVVNNDKVDTRKMDYTQFCASVPMDRELEKKRMKKLVKSLSLGKYLCTYKNFLDTIKRKEIGKVKASILHNKMRRLDKKHTWPFHPLLALKAEVRLSRDLNPKKPYEKLMTGMNPMHPKTVLKAVESLIKLIEPEGDFFSDEIKPVYIQITSVKIPITSRHPFFIQLPHSHIPGNADVCLITKNLRKHGKLVDCETTVQYYRECLRKWGITRISEIITLRQLITVYEVYEMKRALFRKFDFFVVQRSIWSCASHYLGRDICRRKTPIPATLQKKCFASQIRKALRTTCFTLHPTGNTYSFKVGHRHLEATKICDNIIAASQVLKKRFPGRWGNILSLSIKGPNTTSIPLHLSVARSNEVPVPVVKPGGHDNEVLFGSLNGKTVQVAASGEVSALQEDKRNYLRNAVSKAERSCVKVEVEEDVKESEEDE